MESAFEGVRLVAPARLYVSQLYISRAKLVAVQAWLGPGGLEKCRPVPVFDFGDGNLTLTDGHTRAFALMLLGLPCPVCYEADADVVGAAGRMAYGTAIRWCRDAGVCTVGDLRGHVLEQERYRRLWVERCERAFSAAVEG